MQTLAAFLDNQGPDFDGRSVNVEITKKERGGQGGRRGGSEIGRKPFGNKREGGFGRKRSSDGGGSSRRRSSDASRRSDRPDRPDRASRSASDRGPGGFGRRRRD